MNVFKLIEDNGLKLDGDIEHFAELVAQQEREACAVLCENFYRHGNWITKEEAAAAIRARGVVHASDISQERVNETAKDRHEPESNNVEAAAEQSDNYAAFLAGVRFARVNLPALPKKEWVGLAAGEAKMFYDSNLNRADLINKIDDFLEEKNS